MKRFVEQSRARQDNTCAQSDAAAHAEKFPDLRSAGRELAARLDAYRGRADAFVLAVARGGVPVALAVAREIGLPLDLVIIRRLFAPGGPHATVCAVNACGTLVLDEGVPPPVAAPRSAIEYFIADALEGLAQRAKTCRNERLPTDLSQKTILLIDNGIYTGSTMCAAVRALRTLGPARIVAAVPVTSPDGRAAVEAVADEMLCLATHDPFGHVGLWYKNFDRPEDEQIRALLKKG
jgi:putative phosphoribosyl transferase